MTDFFIVYYIENNLENASFEISINDNKSV